MKIKDTCPCGAKFKVEFDSSAFTDEVRAFSIRARWFEMHDKCWERRPRVSAPDQSRKSGGSDE